MLFKRDQQCIWSQMNGKPHVEINESRISGKLVHKDSFALINRARAPYEEIFVLTFKVYGPNAGRSLRLEHQNKYFLYGQD